jgi:hypothetical protein
MKPTALLALTDAWKYQYWSECADDAVVANAFCTNSSDPHCDLERLPLGVTEITVQSVDRRDAFIASSCATTIEVRAPWRFSTW